MEKEFSDVLKARILKFLEMKESELSSKSEASLKPIAKQALIESKEFIKKDFVQTIQTGNSLDLSKGLSQISANIQKALESSVAEIRKEKVSVRDKQGRFYSLIKLQNVINTKLFDTIKKNMGKGSAVSVLNYRTGRFARSVQVDKLLLDRDASITAFYTWMKHPYETFSPGFKQGHIKSRDPVVLIGKSIREIAETIVRNKLKAISK